MLCSNGLCNTWTTVKNICIKWFNKILVNIKNRHLYWFVSIVFSTELCCARFNLQSNLSHHSSMLLHILMTSFTIRNSQDARNNVVSWSSTKEIPNICIDLNKCLWTLSGNPSDHHPFCVNKGIRTNDMLLAWRMTQIFKCAGDRSSVHIRQSQHYMTIIRSHR